MSREKIVGIATNIIGAIALVLVAFGVLTDGTANQPSARGTSNFDIVSAEQLTSTDDLTVTDDADIGGSINIGTSNLYPLLNATDGQAVYAATATITGTSAIAAGTHGFSTIIGAVCDINAAPGVTAGDPAFCVPVVSGTTVTITVKQDDWTTNATSGVSTSYVIIGTP